MIQITINSVEELTTAARQFVQAMNDRSVFAFYGKMGAGKTTFIKTICEVMGVEDVVTSPTFAIVNEYAATGGKPVYHFDFYRIKSLREACDIGCEEYFYSGSPCFIEWPEMIEELLPEDTVSVRIEINEDGTRAVSLTS